MASYSKIKYSTQKRIALLVETNEKLQEEMRPLIGWTDIEEVTEDYNALYALMDSIIARDARLLAETAGLITRTTEGDKMVKIRRTRNKYMLTVQENDGEKFYCLYDILHQTNRTPEALKENQTPIRLDCRIIHGYRYTGEDFLQSVFVDEDGLNQLIGE